VISLTDTKSILPREALPPLMQRLEDAMREATAHTAQVEAEHRAAFALQMREKLGVATLVMDEPHLPKRLLYESLRYLRALDGIAQTLVRMAAEDGFRTTQFNPQAPLAPQLERRIALAQTRHALSMKQSLDLERQEEAGLANYIWRTVGDERVRAEHADLEGQIRSLNDSPRPGEEFGCRCAAEPTLLGADGEDRLPKEPAGLTEDEIIAILILLGSMTPAGRAIRIAAVVLQRYGPDARQVLERWRRDEGSGTPQAPKEPKPAEPAPQTAKEILNPNGKPIGQPGNRSEVRIEKGGDTAAKELYEKLSTGGTPYKPKNYPGEGTKLPNGDWVGYRPSSRSGPPTVDVNVSGADFTKIHFP
jgi:SPP1 gp7 family putative phage head morphogenesis protein